MKKKKLKLSLNKMTVARINVSAVKGGESGPVTAPSVEYCPTEEQCFSPIPCDNTAAVCTNGCSIGCGSFTPDC